MDADVRRRQERASRAARSALRAGGAAVLTMFTVETKQAIIALADKLSADGGSYSPNVLAELVLDRINIRGKDAAREIDCLITEHGYPNVEQAAAKLLQMWNVK
jgi:hypothetical protein